MRTNFEKQIDAQIGLMILQYIPSWKRLLMCAIPACKQLFGYKFKIDMQRGAVELYHNGVMISKNYGDA